MTSLEAGKLYWFTPNGTHNYIYREPTYSSTQIGQINDGHVLMFLGYANVCDTPALPGHIKYIRILFKDMVGYIACFYYGEFNADNQFKRCEL